MSDQVAQQELSKFEAVIGEWQGVIQQKVLRSSRKVKDKTTKEEKVLPAVYTFRPVLTSAASAIALFTGLVMSAEENSPGSGVKLAERYLGENFDDSFKAVVRPDGNLDDGELIKSYIDPNGGEHRRGLASIDAEITEVLERLRVLSTYSVIEGMSPEVRERVEAARDAAGLSNEDLIRNYVELNGRYETLTKIKAEREKAREESKAKRDKAKAAKAAAPAVA